MTATSRRPPRPQRRARVARRSTAGHRLGQLALDGPPADGRACATCSSTSPPGTRTAGWPPAAAPCSASATRCSAGCPSSAQPVLESPDVEDGPPRPEAAGHRRRPPPPAAARPRVRRGRARAGRLRVGSPSDCLRVAHARGSARRGAGVADRNRLESGRWQRCQPRVRIPPPLPGVGQSSGWVRPGSGRTALASSSRRAAAAARAGDEQVDADQQRPQDQPDDQAVDLGQARPRPGRVVGSARTWAIGTMPRRRTRTPTSPGGAGRACGRPRPASGCRAAPASGAARRRGSSWIQRTAVEEPLDHAGGAVERAAARRTPGRARAAAPPTTITTSPRRPRPCRPAPSR